jgi:hypothetical protein
MDIKKIIEDIESMTKDHHIEIFKIINNFNIKYTENNNGVFINMSNMSEDCLNKINNFVNFINENKKNIIEFEKIKEESKLKLNQASNINE